MYSNIKDKFHLTIDQQIELLKNRNLKINDLKKAKWYLERYNYQSIINGYNDPFMSNFNRSLNLYDYNSSFDSIIELFNYDRLISSIVLYDIQNIERTLSHKISYVISEEMCIHKQNKGKILSIDENLFSILFKENIKFEEFVEIATKYIKKSDNSLFKKYKLNELKIDDIPIWTLCLSWSFGDLITIFKSLNKNLQKKIINSYENLSWNIDEFIRIMTTLNKVRNRAAHNNVLYNISIKLNYFMKPFFKKNFDLQISFHSNSISLYDIVKIIDKISNIDKSNRSLKAFFVEKTNEIIKLSKNISEISKKHILNKMNFFN